MEASYLARWELEGVGGVVVVIDVLRAFTTAAFAFAAGAREIVLVSTVDEALALRERLAGALQGLECVRAVRGRGLMIGVELARPCGDLVAQARERGLLINVTAERVVRLLPPLILTRADAALLADTLVELIREFCSRV